MAKRNGNGQFQSKTQDQDSGSSTPPATDDKRKPVVERARTALEEILDAAILSKDHDRILEASKLLANFRKGAPDEIDPVRERLDFILRNASAAEKTEIRSLLFRLQTIYAAIGLNLGLKPLFRESKSSADQALILDAAREEIARRTA